jgi:hypothetical protein
MNTFVNDLQYAQTTGRFVEIGLLSGESLLKCVHDVNTEEGFVSLYARETLGDKTTTKRIALDQIASTKVTDSPCPT